MSRRLHTICTAEMQEIKEVTGCGHVSDIHYMINFREGGIESFANKVSKGHLCEIARIVRKYLPPHIKLEEYRTGAKAWGDFRKRLDMHYIYGLSFDPTRRERQRARVQREVVYVPVRTDCREGVEQPETTLAHIICKYTLIIFGGGFILAIFIVILIALLSTPQTPPPRPKFFGLF